MGRKLPIIREIFKGDDNVAVAAVAAKKLNRKQISALSRMLYPPLKHSR